MIRTNNPGATTAYDGMTLGSAGHFVPVNGADSWPHLVLGVGMIGLGVALRRVSAGRRTV